MAATTDSNTTEITADSAPAPTPSEGAQDPMVVEGDATTAAASQPTSTTVLGLDVGSSQCVVAAFQLGDVTPHVVNNNISMHSTSNLVSFDSKSGQRFIGEEATNLIVRNAVNTIGQVNRLFGKKLEEAVSEGELVSHALVADANGRAAVEVDVLGDRTTLSPEHIAAMLMKRLRSFASAELAHQDGPVPCVITMPTGEARVASAVQAARDAARLAGLDVVRVVTDTEAVGVLHGYKHNADTTEPRHVIVVDVGHADTSVQVFRFLGRTATVVATGYHADAGGRLLDHALARHLADRFKAKHGLDVLTRARQRARLHLEAAKAKKVLSTTDTAMVDIAALAEDLDLHERVGLDVLLAAAAPVLERITATVAQALADSGVAAADLASAQIVGGCTRVPAVRQAIENALPGVELRTNVNADTCVAEGAALVAAMARLGVDYTLENSFVSDESGAGAMSAADFEATLALEARLETADALVAAKAAARNALEEYVYRTKGRAQEGESRSSLNDAERSAVLRLLQEAADWLDAESEFAELPELGEQLAKLQAAVDAAAPGLAAFLAEEAERRKVEDAEAARAAQESLEAAKNKPPRDRPLNNAQRIPFAEKKKEQGTVCFKEFDYVHACEKYVQGIGALEPVDTNALSADDRTKYTALKLSLHLNAAACFNHMQAPDKAVHNCDEALKLAPDNVKALFRRAQGLSAMKRFDDALRDLRAAEQLDPSSKDVTKLIADVTKKQQAQLAKEKQMYEKMFSARV